MRFSLRLAPRKVFLKFIFCISALAAGDLWAAVPQQVLTADIGGFAMRGSISADGRYVAYQYQQSASVPNAREIHLIDRQTGIRRVISNAPDGSPSDREALSPVISGDGSVVTFTSAAMNLGSPTYGSKLFLYHVANHTLEVVHPGGASGSVALAVRSAVSFDGNYVAWMMQLGGQMYVYLRNMTSKTTAVFVVPGVGWCRADDDMTISENGRHVSFCTNSSAYNPRYNQYVLDTATGASEQVNVSSTGIPVTENNYQVGLAQMSRDARFVAFISYSALTPDDNNNTQDEFIRDRTLHTTTNISRLTYGGATQSVLSGNGRYVAWYFSSFPKGFQLYDRQSNTSKQVETGHPLYQPFISDTGRYLIYSLPIIGETTQLVLVDLGDPPAVVVSPTTIAATEGGIAATYSVSLSAPPTSDVVVKVATSTQVTASPAQLTFTPANWNAAQVVSVKAVSDGVFEGAHSTQITHSVSSADLNYNGLVPSAVTVEITDSVVPTVTVATVNGIWNQPTLLVSGTAAPNATVLLSITNTGTGTISASSAVANAQGAWSLSVGGLSDGTYELVADADGIKSTKLQVKIDSHAPVSSLTLNSSATKTADGWYNASVTATVSAVDPAGGQGVLRSEYTLDAGATTVFPAGGLTIGTDGAHSLCYRSIDNANNVETFRCVSVAIDLTAPNATAAFDQGTNKLSITATDSGSGVKTVETSVDGGVTWVVQTGPIAFSTDGNVTVVYRVSDKAGNIKTGQLSFNVATPPVVTAGAAQVAVEASSKTFTLGSFSDADPNGTWAIDVDWGDGTAHDTFTRAAPGSLGSLAHAFADNGNYIIAIKVTDQNGSSDTKTLTITVANVAPTATLNLPTQAFVGAPVTISLVNPTDVSAKDTAAGLRFAFACNGESLDGVSYAGAVTSASNACTYSVAGTATVRARVFDKDGGSTEYTGNINVVIPVTLNLNFTGAWTQPALPVSGTAAPGAAVQVVLHNTATGSNTTANATANTDGTWSTSISNLADGSYTVVATVGDLATDPVTVVIDYRAPVSTVSLSSSGSPSAAGWYNAVVLASATAVDPANGTGVARIEYALDNGQFAAIPLAGAAIDSDAQHSLCTRAIDNAGNIETAHCVNVWIDRGGPALTPQFNSATNTFSLAATDALSGLDSVEYSSDGGATWTSYVAPVSFAHDGNVTMMVRARDKAGNMSTSQLSFNVATPPVVTAAQVQVANEGASTTFQMGSFSDQDAQSSWTIDVDWGDGSAHTPLNVAAPGAIPAQAHSYADNGSYTVTVSVTDANGSRGTNSYTVNVANVAPTGQLSVPATAAAGTNVPVSILSAADVSPSDVAAGLHYAFSCDGSPLSSVSYGSASTSNNGNCVYTSAGTRTVLARVLDKDGGFTEYSSSVSVSIVAQDVTAGTGTAASQLVFNKKGHEYSGTVTITNNTALPFPGPVYVIFDGINVHRVVLENATGTYQGKYYIMLDVASLAPGASITFPITLRNPSSADMNYTLQIYAGKLP